MKRAKDLLSVFKPHLDQLIGCADNPNVFVSGSVALQLMGFRIRREPEDLDIAIYQPTKKQLDLLNMFDVVFDKITGDGRQYATQDDREEEIDTDAVYEVDRLGFKCNFIIKAGLVPENRTYVRYHESFYPVQRVSNIFDAKLAYWREKDRDDIAFVIHHNLTKK